MISNRSDENSIFETSRFRSIQKSQESRMLQYRHASSFPLLTLPRDFPRETIVSISNRCSIKIPFPFRSTPSTGVENGKIVDDHHWTNGYSYKLQNAWILNVERGFDSISRGPDPEQLGEREEVDSGARSLVACCDAACYIGWNLLTLRQRPRLVDAVHVSSNVTPCRAATRSCIERVPLVLAALWGGDPPRVSDRIHTNLCGFSTPVTVGFFLSLYVSTCTRRFSSPTLIILHVIVRDSTLPHKRWNESLALDRWRIFWSFVARVEVAEPIPRENEMFDGSFSFETDRLISQCFDSFLCEEIYWGYIILFDLKEEIYISRIVRIKRRKQRNWGACIKRQEGIII